jgi:alkylation response protein AidB-like acyl-CoA dehydrogenase
MDTVLSPTSVNRAAVRAFVDAELVPHAGDFDAARRVPAATLGRLAEIGAWGALVPAGDGGLGLDLATVVVLHEEVGRGCSSVRSLLTVHGMVSWSVARWGGEHVRARWLPSLVSGSTLGAFCLTEPGAGSDAAGTASTAAEHAGGWRLNGRKQWVTGGLIAGLFLVFARTSRGMSAFLVPADAPGLSIRPAADLLGTRASMVAEVDLDDCEVPAEALLGPDGFALATVLSAALDIGRLSVAAGCVGILQACLDTSVNHSARRRQGGAPLSDRQLVRRMVTDMATDTVAARLLCERAAGLRDAGDPDATTAILMAKYFASTAAMRAATDAVQIHGAAGCTERSDVARYLRDAKVMEIIEGSSEIQQILIADAAYRGRRP